MAKEVAFAFFPYLRTEERVKIRGIEFRSNRDLDGIPTEFHEHLATLSEMFFLEDGVRIERMTCACVELLSAAADQEEIMRRLHEVQLLVGFLYSSPHPSGGILLPSENSALFVFRRGDTFGQQGMVPTCLVWRGTDDNLGVKRVDSREISPSQVSQGYCGTRNHKVNLWVAKGSRIYPELPHVTLNYFQNLSANLQEFFSHPYQWSLEWLYSTPYNELPEIRSRVLVAIEWYMRSCRASIAETEELANLAIALESLLNIAPGEKDRITERFKNAVLTLIGPVPKLEMWVGQFYDARSKAIHEGAASDLMFHPYEKKGKEEKHLIPHRSLVEYGRRIFRICLGGVLSGAAHTRMVGLDALFITNQERLEEICKVLSSTDSPEKRLLNIEQSVAELCDQTGFLHDPNRVTISCVLAAIKRAIQALKDGSTPASEAAKQTIDALLSGSWELSSVLLTRLEECAKQLRAGHVASDRSPPVRITNVVLMLLEYATDPSFKLHCYLMENPPTKS